ncbi:MAG: hypothetical protein AB7F88_01960 [Pyrinomonadaceae bacterium]
MKITVFLFIILASPNLLAQDVAGWNGIVPMVSTRDDVRKQFGEPKDGSENGDLYYMDDYKASFQYLRKSTQDKCSGIILKKGLVTDFLLIPRKPIRLEDLNLGPEFVRGAINDDLSIDYINARRGISYGFDQSRKLITIHYYPPKSGDCLKERGEWKRNVPKIQPR